MIKINTYFLAIAFGAVSIFLLQPLAAQSDQSGHSLNKKSFSPDSTGNYSFFVSGHFHGSSKNTSGKPAQTLLQNISRINAEKTGFMVSLGDLFLDVKNDIPNYSRLFIDKINVPLFNVPGNHDKSGNIYEENFGITYFNFKIQSELYIFLDTELDDGNITGDQWSMVEKALENLTDIDNIFIFSHRLIWAENHPDMKHLFTDNTRSSGENNFQAEVLPAFKNTGKNIFFFGGSLGNAPSPFFYHHESKIHYIATAIRDTPKDAFLKVNIDAGKVRFSAFPLIMPIEYYNLDYYNKKNQAEPGFNWRLVPLYLKTMLLHRYFWYGIMMIGIPVFSLFLYRRTRKRK